MVLGFNWTGDYTQPGPRLYPHQWSRDLAFIAIWYAHWSAQRRSLRTSSKPGGRTACCPGSSATRALYGCDEPTGSLRQTVIDLCQNEEFYECFEPASGAGQGSILFSWTAALLLDVLMDDRSK